MTESVGCPQRVKAFVNTRNPKAPSPFLARTAVRRILLRRHGSNTAKTNGTVHLDVNVPGLRMLGDVCQCLLDNAVESDFDGRG